MDNDLLLLEYTNLLHLHKNANAIIVTRFVCKHEDNVELMHRIRILNALFAIQEAYCEE